MPDAAGRAPAPGENDVRGQIERILRDPLFQHSERLSAFFRFIVEMALAGRGAEIKESVLGTEVFGRGPSYDPVRSKYSNVHEIMGDVLYAPNG
jgi:hypothetical protein